jgi:hypothetical protein
MYQNLCHRKGARTANQAVARHLAALIYTLITNHTEYDVNFRKEEMQKQKERDEKKLLTQLAKQLGYDVSKKASLSNGYAVSSL